MTNVNTEGNATLALIEDELAGVVALYEQLVEQSDKLADAMQCWPDQVLLKVMPKLAADRRDTARIVTWFDGCRANIIENIEYIETARIREERRERLLSSLNLTDAQKELLFED